jgi:hypothetical protein
LEATLRFLQWTLSGSMLVGSLLVAEAATADEPAPDDTPNEATPPADESKKDPPAEEEETVVLKKKGDEKGEKKKDQEVEDEEPEDEDGVRFRGGISGGGGLMMFATDSSLGGTYKLGIGGVDGRVGVQINDLIGVYLQPQLGIYGGKIGEAVGVGGLAGAALLVDFTFIDQIFVAVGGGGGILNNPAAGELIVRFGGYPAFGMAENNIQRKGLMLGIDFRLFVAPTSSGTLIAPSPTLNIGYEVY